MVQKSPWVDEHQVLYYALVLRGCDGHPPLPAAEFLTVKQYIASVESVLLRWHSDMSHLTGRMLPIIHIIVTDISFAAMNSV